MPEIDASPFRRVFPGIRFDVPRAISGAPAVAETEQMH